MRKKGTKVGKAEEDDDKESEGLNSLIQYLINKFIDFFFFSGFLGLFEFT